MKNDLTTQILLLIAGAIAAPPTRPTWTGSRNRKNLKLRFGSNIYTHFWSSP
jgi:hypothetical protein